MMAYLGAAVVVVSLLCLFNLVLAVGIIRRLRQQASELARLRLGGEPSGAVPVGERVGEFTATTTSGEMVSRDALSGRVLVGFFTPGCQPCATELPLFEGYARSLPDRPRQVLAVINVDLGNEAEYAERLAGAARVVVESSAGPLHGAFGVAAFPLFFVVDGDGIVRDSGHEVSGLTRVPELKVTAA
jgi:thiol-disulfide isomerase/thioredoxin